MEATAAAAEGQAQEVTDKEQRDLPEPDFLQESQEDTAQAPTPTTDNLSAGIPANENVEAKGDAEDKAPTPTPENLSADTSEKNGGASVSPTATPTPTPEGPPKEKSDEQMAQAAQAIVATVRAQNEQKY